MQFDCMLSSSTCLLHVGEYVIWQRPYVSLQHTSRH